MLHAIASQLIVPLFLSPSIFFKKPTFPGSEIDFLSFILVSLVTKESGGFLAWKY